MRIPHNTKPYLVPAVERAVAILHALAEAPEGLTLTEVATSLGLPMSSARNLLITLEHTECVRVDPATGRYGLGITLFHLGTAAVARLGLRQVAQPHLMALAAATGETVNLGILQGGEAIYLESVQGPLPVNVRAQPGQRLLLHNTALGKALIARLTDEQREDLLAQAGMPARTGNTCTDPAALRQELQRMRVQGYAIDDEEEMEGSRCIGAPVFGHDGTVVAAVSLSAPAFRLPLDQIDDRAQAVVATAEAITRDLGGAGTEGSRQKAVGSRQ